MHTARMKQAKLASDRFNTLSADLVGSILVFLPWKQVCQLRRLSKALLVASDRKLVYGQASTAGMSLFHIVEWLQTSITRYEYRPWRLDLMDTPSSSNTLLQPDHWDGIGAMMSAIHIRIDNSPSAQLVMMIAFETRIKIQSITFVDFGYSSVVVLNKAREKHISVKIVDAFQIKQGCCPNAVVTRECGICTKPVCNKCCARVTCCWRLLCKQCVKLDQCYLCHVALPWCTDCSWKCSDCPSRTCQKCRPAFFSRCWNCIKPHGPGECDFACDDHRYLAKYRPTADMAHPIFSNFYSSVWNG